MHGLPSHATASRLPALAGGIRAGLCLFLISGGCSLGYELIWVRLLTLEFGSTTLAVSTAVAVFMGGLSLGAILWGRRADGLARPLATYGRIEIGLACYAAASPFLFPAVLARSVDVVLAAEGFVTLSLLRLAVSAGLLLPPTILMGATLPVLTRWYADERGGRAGEGAGFLYGLNTLGGFVGVLVSGFVLLPHLGLAVASIVLAVANLVAGLTALGLARKRPSLDPRQERRFEKLPAPERWPVFAVALTGCAALIFQVAWTRVLSLVLGASVFAFTVVLATVLAGLGLGAAGFALFRPSPDRARRLFGLLTLATAWSVAISFAWSRHLPSAYLGLFWKWGLDHHPERIVEAQFVLSALAMLGPAVLMGTLFPAATYAAVRHDASAGARVSLLYAAGTLGAIAGGLAGGFVLMPAAGLPGSVLVIAFLEVSASTLALRGSGRAWTAACSATAIAVLVLAGAAARTWRPHLMTAGVFQYAQTYRHVPAHRLEARLARSEELLFYRDGLTATVTVTRDRQSPNRDLYVSTNGKIDGSSHSDMPTQRLSAHLPLVLHPDPRDVCVIGLGTGCTAGSASLHPLRSLKVVEIEAAMVEAARFFASDNHGLLANPRVAVNVTDGRLFLRTRPADFDVVISEPSNPWLAGASDLFTREFFALGARALRPNGIFCQWVQLYGLAPENLRMLVRTFVSVFPHTVVATTIADTDILLIGSREPVTVDLARIAARMTQTDIAGDLADPRVGIDSPLQLVSRLRMGPMETRAFAGEGLLHTDDRPLIAYRAPRDLYRWTRHLNSALIARHARGIARYLASSPTPEETASALRRLAELYEAFMPGGQEAADTREIAARLEGLQGTDLSTAGR